MIIYAFVGAGAFSIVGGLMFISPKDGKLAQANLSQAVVQQEQPQAQPATSGKSGGAITVADVEISQETKEQREAKDKEKKPVQAVERNSDWACSLGGVDWYVSFGNDEDIHIWNYEGVNKRLKWAARDEYSVYANEKGVVEGDPTIVVRYQKNISYTERLYYLMVGEKECPMKRI